MKVLLVLCVSLLALVGGGCVSEPLSPAAPLKPRPLFDVASEPTIGWPDYLIDQVFGDPATRGPVCVASRPGVAYEVHGQSIAVAFPGYTISNTPCSTSTEGDSTADGAIGTGFDQPGPITVTFSRPAAEAFVYAFQLFNCEGDHGSVTAYDSSGNSATTALISLDPALPLCGQYFSSEESPFGARVRYRVDYAIDLHAVLPALTGVQRIVITPPAIRAWETCNAVFHGEDSVDGSCGPLTGPENFAVYFREGAPAAAVRLTSVNGSLDVRPAGTGVSILDFDVGVYDDNGAPIPNRDVVISLEAHEGTAGHLHAGGKPKGTSNPVSVHTGATGVQRFRYNAPVASGPVTIRAESNDAQAAEKMIKVRVPGLVGLVDGVNYNFVGLPSQHDGRFHGTSDFVATLQALADSLAAFAARIPSLPPDERPSGTFPAVFGINDMSLAEGGLFDYQTTWAPPHADHRVGIEADVDVRGGSDYDDYADYVTLIWETKLGHHVGDERADRNHFHLRY